MVNIDLTDDNRVPDDGARMLFAGQQLVVDSQQAFETAAEIIKVCAERIKEHEAGKWGRLNALLNQIKELVMDKLNGLRDPYIDARKLLQPRMEAWVKQQDANVEQTQKAIQASGEAVKTNLLEEAAKLKREGDLSGAKHLIAQAGQVVTDVILAPTVGSIPGLSQSRPLKAEFKPNGEMLLLTAIADGKVPLFQTIVSKGKPKEVPVIEFNMTCLNWFAKKMPGEIEKRFPGVKAVAGVNFSVRDAED